MKTIQKLFHHRFCLTSLCVFLLGIVQAQQEYLPTEVPDRILLNITEKPHQSMGVSWRTDTVQQVGWVEVALATGSPEVENVQRVSAAASRLEVRAVTAHYFEATLNGLLPDTTYLYRVGNGKVWSEWLQFRTAAAQQKPFHFLYVGDAQNDHKEWWSRVIRSAFQHAPKAAFILHAGDLINRSNVDAEWGEWFYAGGWMHGMIPTVATPGNHEFYRDEQKRLMLTQHWRPIFNLPLNGPKGFEETVYYFDYQGTRVVSLSSQNILLSKEDSIVQIKWLEDVLAKNPMKWTIITMHHPIFSAGTGRDNTALRDALQPIFEKYHVDLVLTGHDHTYGRGVELESKHLPKQSLKGPVYVVSVSGPKMYVPALSNWLQRAASNTQLFQRVMVDDKKIRVEAYTPTGALYDAFDILKDAKGNNTLVDWAPGLMKEQLELPEAYRKRYTEEEKKAYESRVEAYKKRKAAKKQ